jgi:hypothetical protein
MEEFISAHSHLRSELINILLVHLGVRTATWVEIQGTDDEEADNKESIVEFFNFFRQRQDSVQTLFIKDFNGFLVSNSNFNLPRSQFELGKLLDFNCANFFIWHNEYFPRLTCEILDERNNQIYVEICPATDTSDTSLEHRVRFWNHSMIINHFPYRFHSKTTVNDGIVARYNNIDNDQYVWTNYSFYVRDLANKYFSETEFYNIDYFQRYPVLFRYLYRLAIGNVFIVDKVTEYLERQLFRASPRNYESIIFNHPSTFTLEE